VTVITILVLCNYNVVQSAAPPAGTSIGNQASATYTDSSGVQRTATSNIAITIVQQVASFSLTADNTRVVAPGGQASFPHTIINTGNSAATSLMLMDVIPVGMTYVAGSARWSGSGATPLTDTAGGDPAGILYDFNVTQAGRVTATIATVASGQSGYLTFQVNINSGLAPGTINNTATYVYDPGTGTSVGPFNSNTALFTVDQLYNLSATGQTIANANQGATVAFTNVVVNTGNGPDAFEVFVGSSTFPPGTTFALFQSDGYTSFMDYDNDGYPATPLIPPGGSYNVIIKAVLPATVSGGGPYTVQKTIRSNTDYSKTTTVTDTLTTITGNNVVSGSVEGGRAVGSPPS
jgi:uncharacterized repeat protein (TIGR01451 family)